MAEEKKRTTDVNDVRLSFRSPSEATLLDEVAGFFPDETGRRPDHVEKLRNGNTVSTYGELEYEVVGDAFEKSTNRVHAVETDPDGVLVSSHFVVGNSYGEQKDGPELRRIKDGWAFHMNGAITTSDEYLSSNSIIFDRNGNLDKDATERDKGCGDFYISPKKLLASVNIRIDEEVQIQQKTARTVEGKQPAEGVRLLFEKDSSGSMSINMKDGRTLPIDGASAGSEGLYVIRKDGKFNYVSEDGSLLLKNWVDAAGEFRNGKAKCRVGNDIFEIDRTASILKVTLGQQQKDVAASQGTAKRF